ncbi:MAG: glutathione S-transferase family protein [Parvibaculaceae bacterium]
MKLYEDPKAPNPRRVRIFLAEKGIEVAREPVEIMALAHKSPEMLKLNPMARLPFLVLDDGCVIAETMAICRYFEVLQPEPRLLGSDAADQATVEMWQRRVEQELLTRIMHAFRHSHPRMAALEAPQVKAWADANLPRIEDMLGFLDGELARRQHIAGDRFSVADITALCAIDFMRVIRLSLDKHPNLKRWHESVSARPSASA